MDATTIPGLQVWFEMVDEFYSDELWYDIFRITKETLVYILSKIKGDISQQQSRQSDVWQLPCIIFGIYGRVPQN